MFDLQEGQEVASYQAAADTINGFHFHPFLPMAATASGKPRLLDFWLETQHSSSFKEGVA